MRLDIYFLVIWKMMLPFIIRIYWSGIGSVGGLQIDRVQSLEPLY